MSNPRFGRMPSRLSAQPTPRQLEVLACIRKHIAEHGQAPSRRELAAALGLRGVSSLANALAALERRGLIAIDDGAPRGIVVLEAAR